MANKAVLSFAVQFLGDGSSTTISINVKSGPLFFPVGSQGPLSPLFNAVASEVTGVYEQSGGLTVTNTTFNIFTQTMTVTFSTAPTSGTVYTLFGVLEF
jgi:hypothetical protein